MQKLLLIPLFVLIFYGPLFAQTRQVSGRVIDGKDGTGIAGATVKIKGGTAGSQTDADGSFRIQAEPGDILVFGFLGYITQEQKASGQQLRITLKQNVRNLSEVVVSALGTTRELRSLTNSEQVVKGAEVAQTQRENFVNSLQGRIAGASIVSTSGAPGASASIILRGATSLQGNNQPLFIIDGLPVSNRTFSQGALYSDGPNRNNDYSNRISDINPDDIESISVLKGASAAALYGIDAAGGAIVITTKKGHVGKSNVTYSNDFRFENAYRFPKEQTTFGLGTNGLNDPAVRSGFGAAYPAGTTLYDNIHHFFKTGFTQKEAIAFDGGNENATYRLSSDYTDQKGVVPTTDYKRFTLNLNGSNKFSSKFSTSASVQFSNVRNDKGIKGQGGYLLGLLQWPLNDDVRKTLNPDRTRRLLNPANNVELDNPLYTLNLNKSSDKTSRVIASAGLTYDPFNWLNVAARGNADIFTTTGNTYLNPASAQFFTVQGNSLSGISANGIIENYVDNSQVYNGQVLATFKKDFGKLSTSLLVGTSLNDNNDEVNTLYGTNVSLPGFNSINVTNYTTQRGKNKLTQRRLIAEFTELKLDWNNMLYLDATARRDQSSTLPVNHNSFFSPSVGLGFVFTELAFLKGSHILPFGKLRASFAVGGKDAPASYITGNILDAVATTGAGFMLDVFGGNPGLRPEKTSETEFGTDLRFFDGRVGLNATWYSRKSVDQIVGQRISYGTGFVLKYINSGTLKNEGIELELTGNPVRTNDFSWDVYANFTHTSSQVASLPLNVAEFYNSDTWLSSFNVRASLFPGGNLTTLGATAYARNKKGQVLINPVNGYAIKNSFFSKVGDRNPNFVMGLGNTFRYRNWGLNFLIDFRDGGDIFNGTEAELYTLGLSTQTLDRNTLRVLKGVLRDGKENSASPTDNTIVVNPGADNRYYTQGFVESDFIQHRVNWIRLRDITLSYSLPGSITGGSHLLQNLTLFMTATNVFIITNYKGADPDVNGLNASAGGIGGGGFDYGVVSNPRGINFGLKIKI